MHGIISRKDIYVSSCSVKNMAYTTRNIYFVQCYNVIILLILKRCYYSFWVMSKKQNIALQANRRIYYLIPRSLTVNRRNSYFWLKYHDYFSKEKVWKATNLIVKLKQTQKQMHYTKLFYYSESVLKVVLFQNFNFSLLSVYGLMHGQNLLY